MVPEIQLRQTWVKLSNNHTMNHTPLSPTAVLSIEGPAEDPSESDTEFHDCGESDEEDEGPLT